MFPVKVLRRLSWLASQLLTMMDFAALLLQPCGNVNAEDNSALETCALCFGGTCLGLLCFRYGAYCVHTYITDGRYPVLISAYGPPYLCLGLPLSLSMWMNLFPVWNMCALSMAAYLSSSFLFSALVLKNK